jgi:hypothetical protein
MSTLATLTLALMLFSACALISSLALTWLWPLVHRASRSAHPRTRTWIAAWAAVGPFAVSAALVVLCLLPGFLPWLGIADDHCTRHGDHPHLCLVHPTASFTPALIVLAIALAGPLVIAAARRTAGVVASLRTVTGLRRAVSEPLAQGIRKIQSPRCFSMAVGVLNPVVVVSSGLTEALERDQLGVVVAHERAHVRRRDSLVRSLAALLSFPLLPTCRRQILDELELASEQACDEEAARDVRDRLLVAETLVAVERLGSAFARALPVTSSGIAGSTLPSRVHAMLADPIELKPSRAAWRWLAVPLFALIALIAAAPIHHAAEHLVELLLDTL